MIDIPEEKKKNMGFMGRSFSILFFALIFITILSVLKSQKFAIATLIVRIIALVIIVFYYIYLTLIKDQNARYGTAGTFGLIAIISDFIIAFLPLRNNFIILLAALTIIALTALGEYHEYLAHAEYFSDVNKELSLKWENLCNIYLIALSATVICTLLMAFIPRIAIVANIISLLVLVIVKILKLVYLYDSGKFLKNYCQPL